MVTVSGNSNPTNPTYPTNPTTINSGELTDKNQNLAVTDVHHFHHSIQIHIY